MNEAQRVFLAAVQGARYEPKLLSIQEPSEQMPVSKADQDLIDAHLKRRMEEKTKEFAHGG